MLPFNHFQYNGTVYFRQVIYDNKECEIINSCHPSGKMLIRVERNDDDERLVEFGEIESLEVTEKIKIN